MDAVGLGVGAVRTLSVSAKGSQTSDLWVASDETQPLKACI